MRCHGRRFEFTSATFQRQSKDARRCALATFLWKDYARREVRCHHLASPGVAAPYISAPDVPKYPPWRAPDRKYGASMHQAPDGPNIEHGCCLDYEVMLEVSFEPWEMGARRSMSLQARTSSTWVKAPGQTRNPQKRGAPTQSKKISGKIKRVESTITPATHRASSHSTAPVTR
jgi:hypothetical protein